ncbi:MAG: DUF5916 domain-containing protein [Bacteroidota bacterium]
MRRFVSDAFLVLSATLTLLSLSIQAETTKVDSLVKTCTAERVRKAPRIDGKLTENEWTQAIPAGGFIQFRPEEGKPATQPTEVRILYTDFALYVGAWCYDAEPDSILTQLGKRDESNLNADYFYIKFDPYQNRQDAYEFGVYASGVQLDSRISDFTYDPVWHSAVGRDSLGWYAEFEIPYSSIRFPEQEEQRWTLQFNRYIRRNRELQSWSYVPSSASNRLLFWGELHGIRSVSTPPRLSVSPYAGVSGGRDPVSNPDGSVGFSNFFSYNFGADVKYGIDDRVTLDMTLLPDFGQVQSDRLVKNLSYREVVYDENRPFFREGVELFGKDDLFYSRRIGRVPGGYFDVFEQLQTDERIISNPISSKLLNAVKVSGRTDKGLGLGFFNAVTDAMYAELESTSGNRRRVMTEPLTNYSIAVVDKQWKNNSSAYFIHTLAHREGSADDAQVIGTGLTLSNRKNTLSLISDGVLTFRHNAQENESQPGFNYSLGIEKNGGVMQYSIERNVTSPEYNVTDLGFYRVPGLNNSAANVTFNRFKPWKFIREANVELNVFMADDFTTSKFSDNSAAVSSFINLMSWNALFVGGGMSLLRPYDFFESRTAGQVYRGFRTWYGYAGFSSDYRKALAIDYSFGFGDFMETFSSFNQEHELSLRIRTSDRLFIQPALSYSLAPINLGYAGRDSLNASVIGARRLDTWEANLRAAFTFSPTMNLTLIARHYWFTGAYIDYYNLDPVGELLIRNDKTLNYDFNFNVFTADLIYEWRFSPGSVINLVYKNSVTDEQGSILRSYGRNFNRIMELPHAYSFTVKLLYFLDYIRVKDRLSGKGEYQQPW